MNTELFRMRVRNAAARRRNFMFGLNDKLVFVPVSSEVGERISTPKARDLRIERQTPPLVPSDIEKMRLLHIDAAQLTVATGIEHHVDHICPIAKGGAHHWLNMSVIPAKANLSKGAKWNGVDGYTYEQLI